VWSKGTKILMCQQEQNLAALEKNKMLTSLQGWVIVLW
jgi:hypothetical protein